MAGWIRAGLTAGAAVILGVALSSSALAHGGRLPFDAWGGFAGGVLRCQRVIAQAAAECATHAWDARRGCREAALAGGNCDEAATIARIADARRAAQDEVDAACSERQAISLQFLGSFDLQQDLISFCRDWEHAADSAVFGPAGATAGPCTTAMAAAASDIMAAVMRERRRCMDRVSASPGGDVGRPALLAGATVHRGRALDHATARVETRCADFASRYGRPARELLTTLAARADCVGGAFYIQDAILCAPSVCGNGVIEPNEDCDDGNVADGDTCPASCVH